MMDYGSDPFSDILLGGDDLFPGYALSDTFTKEPGDLFRDLPQSADLFSQSYSGPENDVFPDWLDLKMDFCTLEGLEGSDNVLDDLLRGEVGYSDVTSGQLSDVLPPSTVENKVPRNPPDFERLPYEHQTLPAGKQTAPAAPLVELDVASPSRTPPPSSPEWIVPDVGDTESSPSLLSPAREAGSPAYSPTAIVPSSPAHADGTVLTFVAPVIQPASGIDTAEVIVDACAIPLDNIMSLSFLISGVNENLQERTETEPSESSLPPSPVATEETPKRERKFKSASKRKPRAGRCRSVNESDSDDSPAPVSKKERKRKQNKDAAMRYRQKKRLETDELADVEGELLEQNKQLKEKTKQLASELGYLKNLMREMFKVRGLLQ